MIRTLITILLLFSPFLSIATDYPLQTSVEFYDNQNAYFFGEEIILEDNDSNSIYVGKRVDCYFNEERGIFTNQDGTLELFSGKVEPGGVSDKAYYIRYGTPNRYTKTTESYEHSYTKYDYSKDKWESYKLQWKDNKIYDLEEGLNLVYIVIFILIIVYSVSLLLRLATKNKADVIIRFTSLIILLLSLTILSFYSIKNILFPSLIIALGYLTITTYITKQRLQGIFILTTTIIVIALYVTHHFFSLNDSATFADNKQIDIKWKPGTNISERNSIKSIISNMTPVTVNAHDTTYTIYVSKYEMTEALFTSSINSFGGSIVKCFRPRDIEYGFTYRDIRRYIRHLYELTGITFDLLSYEEWSDICKNYNKTLCATPFGSSVDEGVPDKFDLYNICGNNQEFLSTHNEFLDMINIDLNHCWASMSDIVICAETPGDYELEDKDDHVLASFRLIYRPNNIGQKKVDIYAYKADKCTYPYRPPIIHITKLNDWNSDNIVHTFNYEYFEEEHIESLFKGCDITGTAIGYDGNKYGIISFTLSPDDLEYDFIPQFSYVGIDKSPLE